MLSILIAGVESTKARVFAQALGFNLSNWELLKQAILESTANSARAFDE